MKLLSKIEVTTDDIYLGGEYVTTDEMEPRSILFTIALFGHEFNITREPRPKRVWMPHVHKGRATIKNIEVDFENEQPRRRWDDKRQMEMPVKYPSLDLEFDGIKYHVHGLMALNKIRDNVWDCSIDYFQTLPLPGQPNDQP